MTKTFCDLCGSPALVWMPSLAVAFPDLAWSGIKSEPGSIANVEGTWVPKITARIIFEQHDTPRSVRTANPDLCGNCVSMLLTKMANITGHPPMKEETK